MVGGRPFCTGGGRRCGSVPRYGVPVCWRDVWLDGLAVPAYEFSAIEDEHNFLTCTPEKAAEALRPPRALGTQGRDFARRNLSGACFPFLSEAPQ